MVNNFDVIKFKTKWNIKYAYIFVDVASLLSHATVIEN